MQALFAEMTKLQTKEQELQRSLGRVNARIAASDRDLRRSTLTQKEVESLPESVRTYQAVGKAFILQDRATMKEILKTDAEKAMAQSKSLKEQQAYHTRQHKETIKQLQELTRGFRQQ